MKGPFRLLVSLFVISILSLRFCPNSVFAQSKESNPKTRQKTFEVVWKTINEKYFDPKFGGVDWVAMHRRYVPQATNVKTDAELYELLGRMLNEIHISHLGIIRLEDLGVELTSSFVMTGLALKDIDNEVVVTRVLEGSSAEKAGLRPGFSMKKVDDVAVVNSYDANQKLSGATQNHRVSFLDEQNVMREAVCRMGCLHRTSSIRNS